MVSTQRHIYVLLIAGICFCLSIDIICASPYFSPEHTFPTAKQSRNACYFNSINIAVEAKFGTKLNLKQALKGIKFDGNSVATWEFKKKFSDLTHIIVREFRQKKDLINLLEKGEPVLVSTEIILKSGKKVRHVSVAYSYTSDGIWVSDPLGGNRKQIDWNDVFNKQGYVKYYNLRVISIKSYLMWNISSKEREEREDIWQMESKLL